MDVVLDLYNFDTEEADGCRYVLTSPRSLEACSRLNIKPAQLLPKTLDEFALDHAGKSIQFIQMLYNEWEEKRDSKLQGCRTEREKIIMQQQLARKKGNDGNLDANNASSVLVSLKLARLLKEPKILMTKSVLNGNDLKTQFHSNDKGIFKSSIPCITTQPPSSCISPSDFSTPRDQRSRTRTNNRNRLRSKSVETQNRNEKWLNSSMSLRSSSVFGSHSRMASGYTTPQIQRDRRLTEMLKEKRKQEEIKEKESRQIMLAWNKEQIKYQESKRKDQLQRNKEIASHQLQWEKKLKQEETKRNQELQILENERREEQKQLEVAVKLNIERQEKKRLSQLGERKRAALEKKLQQEKSLLTVNKEISAFQQATEQEIRNKMQRAERLKLENELKELQKIKLMNKSQRERFAEIHREVEQQKEEEARLKEEALAEKLLKAEKNYFKKVQHRDLNIKCQGKEVNRKILQTKQNQKRIDQQMEEHKRSIAEHKIDLQEKASSVAMQTKQKKSLRALQMRESSERIWKRNLSQVKEKAEEYVQRTKENSDLKENKAKRHLQLKEAAFEFSRAQAILSETERDVIKRKSSNFSHMAEKAKINASIGHGPRSSFVNYSTVKLG